MSRVGCSILDCKYNRRAGHLRLCDLKEVNIGLNGCESLEYNLTRKIKDMGGYVDE